MTDPGVPRPIGCAAHPHERRDPAQGAGEERLLRREQLIEAERPLPPGMPDARGELEHRGARDPRQRAARDAAASTSVPLSGPHEQVARRGFGAMALDVEKQRLVGAGAPRLEQRGDGVGVGQRLQPGGHRALVAAPRGDMRREPGVVDRGREHRQRIDGDDHRRTWIVGRRRRPPGRCRGSR